MPLSGKLSESGGEKNTSVWYRCFDGATWWILLTISHGNVVGNSQTFKNLQKFLHYLLQAIQIIRNEELHFNFTGEFYKLSSF